MESAPSTGRRKHVRYGPADYRAHNAKYNCPRDCQVGVHKCLSHAAREKTDNDVPDKMKHIFSFLESSILKVERTNTRSVRRKPYQKISRIDYNWSSRRRRFPVVSEHARREFSRTGVFTPSVLWRT